MDIDIKLLKCFVHEPMDINKLIDLGYDNENPQFICSFKQLFDLSLITSDSNSCGLHLSADNVATWTNLDLRLTEKGHLVLFPPKESKLVIIKKITSHPVVSALVVLTIVFVVSSVYTFLGSDQEANQNQKPQQPSKLKLTSKPPK